GEPKFEGQFKDIEITPKVEYIKNRKPEKPNQIQAITGATISSDAVVKNINKAVKKVLDAFPKDDILSGKLKESERPASSGLQKEKEDGGK
ncbi:MAG: FMN-binding protein, partial [Deltaproteobacteria bacterium]|nr:FMN-binding protein [Deltaproteobacteria bacterium]